MRKTPTRSSRSLPVTLNLHHHLRTSRPDIGRDVLQLNGAGDFDIEQCLPFHQDAGERGIAGDEDRPDERHGQRHRSGPAEPAVIDQLEEIVPRRDLAGLARHLADQHLRHAARIRYAAGSAEWR